MEKQKKNRGTLEVMLVTLGFITLFLISMVLVKMGISSIPPEESTLMPMVLALVVIFFTVAFGAALTAEEETQVYGLCMLAVGLGAYTGLLWFSIAATIFLTIVMLVIGMVLLSGGSR